MTTSFPPINYPNKPVPPFSAPAPRNPFPGFFPDMWRNITGKPYVTVSSKGLANGLSEYFNDGADFGPDSLQSNGSLTQTTGIQEACTYLEPTGGEIKLTDGIFYFHTGVTYTSEAPLRISGVRPNVTRGVTFTSEMSGGTFIIPASDYPTNNMPLFTFLNTTPGNNNGFVDIGNMGIIGTYIEVGDTVPDGASSTSPVALQFGNTTSLEGGGPVAKNVHDMKIINCVSAIVSYSGGGPNLYDNLHVDGCGYNGTVTINGTSYTNPATFIFYELSQHWGKFEVFSPNGTDVFQYYNSAGGYAPSILVDNIYSNIAGNDIFLINTTLNGVVLEIGNINVEGSANNGNSVIGLPSSGSLTVYLANLYQNGSSLVRQYNSSSTARVDISVGNYHATNSAGIVVNGNSVASGSRLAISNAYLESIVSGALSNSITGLTWTMAHVYPVQTPTLSTNPPVSGTVYQNTNPYDIEIDLPVYATTAGTAGYVTMAKGSTDTPTAISSQYVSGDTSSTSTQIIKLRVPAGWYYSFTGSGVTFATATPFAE